MSIGAYFKTQRLIGRAKNLRKSCEEKSDLPQVLEAVRLERKFSLVQKKDEFTSFLARVKELKPSIIVDIGSSGGGTIRLFSHFADDNARILSIDIDNVPIRQKAFPFLIKGTQHITVYQGSSHDPTTIDYLKEWLSGEEIDLLFIDGDHAYDGVSQDFSLYSPFVKNGGIIGFHDIVEDYKTRYGRETPSYVGEVPRFWREIKPRFEQTEELIQDPEQDGYGIGVIRWQKK